MSKLKDYKERLLNGEEFSKELTDLILKELEESNQEMF